MNCFTAVSVIVPIHNGGKWIGRCFRSILAQTAIGKVHFEVCVCDDASNDETVTLLETWQSIFEESSIALKIHRNSDGPKGVGFSKNRAVDISEGTYLCFHDVDDVMLPDRINCQYERALVETNDTLVGGQFFREPQGSTERYTTWANGLTASQLTTQIYTSHGPTVIMPTWFCHRQVYNSVGGFVEVTTPGTPEDLIFFYAHLDSGGRVYRVEEIVTVYTYHLTATTFSVTRENIYAIRLQRFRQLILKQWNEFTIWCAGKMGRRFYNSLTSSEKEKVTAMCDVSAKLIGTTYVPYSFANRSTGRPVPIIHFEKAKAPFVICVKQGLTNGEFENNLRSLHLVEGQDFYFF